MNREFVTYLRKLSEDLDQVAAVVEAYTQKEDFDTQLGQVTRLVAIELYDIQNNILKKIIEQMEE